MSDIDAKTLSYYADREDWKTLVATAIDLLERDPENAYAHEHLVYAYVNLNTPNKAEPHLESLLRLDLEADTTLLAAIHLKLNQGRFKQASAFVKQALALYPEDALFYYYDAAIAIRKLKTRYAKQQISKAKQLAPQDSTIADLYLRIHGIDDESTNNAVARIREYKRALQFDPVNAALHRGIGDIYMDDLHLAKEASQFYREAVRLEPSNKDYRDALFHAVAMQSLLYGLISLPSRSFSFLGNVARGIALQPWRILFLIFAVKLIGAYLIWLLLATILFWPLSKFYEHLLVSEIRHPERASDRRLRFWFYLQNKSIGIRFSIFGLLAILVYSSIFFTADIPQRYGFQFLGIFVGLHIPFLLAARLYRHYRYRVARNSASIKEEIMKPAEP